MDVALLMFYIVLEVRWLSAEQFSTLYRMPEQTFLTFLDVSTQPEVRRSSISQLMFWYIHGDQLIW
jgi:hypothetical protein